MIIMLCRCSLQLNKVFGLENEGPSKVSKGALFLHPHLTNSIADNGIYNKTVLQAIRIQVSQIQVRLLRAEIASTITGRKQK